MATKVEYDSFKALFEIENNRYAELGNRAKLFMSLITVLFGSLFLKLDVVIGAASRHWWIAATVVASWASFTLALICTLLSLFVRKYEKLFDPKAVAKTIDETNPTEGEFLASRIADFAVATNRNSEQNDCRAEWLRISGIVLLIGFILSFVFLTMVATTTSCIAD